MIELKLEKLKKYEKPILTAFPYDKTGLNKKANYFYLDFETKIIKASNGVNHIEIDFDYVRDEDEKVYNFYVDTHKFFYILKDDKINLKFIEKEGLSGVERTPMFYDDNGEYSITYLPDDNNVFKLPYDVRKGEGVLETFKLNDKDKKVISEASSFFITSDDFNSFVLSEDKIYYITKTHFYVNDLSFNIKNEEVGIHKNAAKIILLFKDGITINTIDEKTKPLAIINEDLVLIIEEKIRYILPPQDKINKVIPTESFIKVKKDDILDALSFFDPFYTTDSKPVEFKIKDNTLECSVTSSIDIIKKELAIEKTFGEVEGIEVKYNASTLKDMVRYISNEVVTFYIHSDISGLLVNEDESRRQMLLVRYMKKTN
jgi:hypothetical protein